MSQVLVRKFQTNYIKIIKNHRNFKYRHNDFTKSGVPLIKIVLHEIAFAIYFLYTL